MVENEVLSIDYEKVRRRLLSSVDDYRAEILERNTRREQMNKLEETRKNQLTLLLGEVSADIDVEGKKRFKNESEREGEVLRRLGRDELHQELLSKIRDTVTLLSKSDANVVVLELECKNLRCVLESLPQELLLKTRF